MLRRVSPERIDSAQGYGRDTIQMACWFANQWKPANPGPDFRRSLALVRH